MQKAGARVANSSPKTVHPHGPVKKKTSRDPGIIRRSFPNPALILRPFGNRLRDLRQQRGLTQIQLADYLGIDRSFISEVECGKKAISLSYLETVAQGFNVSLAELLRDL